MKNLKGYVFLVVIGLLSCQKFDKKVVINNTNSPYDLFFNEVKINNLSDTILVQKSTHLFGCGTAALEYVQNYKKKGLQKFYDKYGALFADSLNIKKFEKNHKTKILWINRGNEGELFELYNPELHKNKALEKRLLTTKTFLSFEENPESISVVNIGFMVNNHVENQILYTNYLLKKSNQEWKIDSISN